MEMHGAEDSPTPSDNEDRLSEKGDQPADLRGKDTRGQTFALVKILARNIPRLPANEALAFLLVEINGEQFLTDVVRAADTP